MTEYKLPNNAGRSRLIKKIIIEVLKLIEFIILKYPAKNIDDASLMPTSPNEIGGIIVLPNNTKLIPQMCYLLQMLLILMYTELILQNNGKWNTKSLLNKN